MAYQTAVEEVKTRPPTEEAPATVLARSFGDCARDVVSLAELQTQLFLVDLKQSAGQAAPPLGIVLLGAALLLGCFPILLMALAYALIEGAGWSAWLSFLVAAIVGLIVGGALVAAGLAFLRSAMTGLGRSRKELADNLRWLKETLTAAGRERQSRQCA